jgi:rare lipoprotein A
MKRLFRCVAACVATCIQVDAALASTQFARGASMYLPTLGPPAEIVGSALNRPAAGRYVLASFYGAGERVSRYTASGERFNPLGLTAAHRSLPLGTRILVALGDRQVIVRVNDRGPTAATGRSLDLSYGAARALGVTRAGVVRVRLSVL